MRRFTFVGGIAPRTFWCRRQAHETAVHRADVEATGPGRVTPVTGGGRAVEQGLGHGRAAGCIHVDGWVLVPDELLMVDSQIVSRTSVIAQ